MTERVEKLLRILNAREYRNLRDPKPLDVTPLVGTMTPGRLDAYRLELMLENEQPRLFEGDRIGFHRTLHDTPFYVDGNGKLNTWTIGNMTPNYARIMNRALDAILHDTAERLAANPSPEQKDYLESVAATVRASLAFADRYREYARNEGHAELFEALTQVPHKPARTFHEACVFMKFIIFTLRCNRNSHLTLGRFDQYMFPFYLHDKKRGVSDEALLECLEEFFISLNFDGDLYPGIQLGDNGQSMVLGGYDAEGNEMFNPLSRLCMQASLELNLIDPKINLRVSKKTPLELYELGTRLTKQGLGFPQYLNDDVVVSGLVKLGYDKKDALDYGVAACWEYIVPNCAFDIPNIAIMNFPKVINTAIHEHLLTCSTFDELLQRVAEGIEAECERQIARANTETFPPSPYLSIYVDGCLEQAQDFPSYPAKYNNFGCHGVGIANAADALAAVKKLVYNGMESSAPRIYARQLLNALDKNFEGYDELRRRLLDAPKMGNNDDYVDSIASALMAAFSKSMNNRPNNRGGICRAGTGSAMEYILSSKNVPATADGRKAFEPYGSSFSPALSTKLDGPLSVIQSFTKYDLSDIINGGPLTLELHDATFRNDEGIRKVALLVKAFIDRGGHQLQLNAINRDRLLDAQKHPEKYPNLIVRVWGWSGYFCELDLQYQDHIIKRTEFVV